MMANVFDVAKYILQRTGKISTWKLQKLCYYSQAWTLAWTGKPLFEEEFEAWRNGPVCRELFARHKGEYAVDESIVSDADIDALSDDEKDSINVVLDTYGNKEPYELRAMSHEESPWKNARRGLGDFDYVDKDGKFAFNPGRSDFKHKEVLQKIIDFSKLTWNEVLSHSTSSRRNSKHHNLSADKLCKDARERLAKISLDDFIDDLFSFALEGELRIIGLKQGNDFYILWYDAHHEVCPSHKK